MQGEKCVLRILDKRRALFELSDLGMPPDMLGTYESLVRSPYGMVICAGPTGSGKTTTLYATLTQINSTEINVMTVEDPVEYVFPSVNQIQINEQAGVTFAGGLRSILRQDPDAILVGEIRDVETARMAVQSALTGHLVLSSIHATDAVSALHRFLDMGIESFLIASSMLGVDRPAARPPDLSRVQGPLRADARGGGGLGEVGDAAEGQRSSTARAASSARRPATRAASASTRSSGSPTR